MTPGSSRMENSCNHDHAGRHGTGRLKGVNVTSINNEVNSFEVRVAGRLAKLLAHLINISMTVAEK